MIKGDKINEIRRFVKFVNTEPVDVRHACQYILQLLDERRKLRQIYKASSSFYDRWLHGTLNDGVISDLEISLDDFESS